VWAKDGYNLHSVCSVKNNVNPYLRHRMSEGHYQGTNQEKRTNVSALNGIRTFNPMPTGTGSFYTSNQIKFRQSNDPSNTGNCLWVKPRID
jgi:hypothetical protein